MRISPFRGILLAGWMVLIFVLSAQPESGDQSGFLFRLVMGPLAERLSADQFEALHHLVRKLAHFTEYAVLALLWVWNLGTAPGRLALAWLFTTVYAAGDELHQAFVPNRGPSAWDVALDSAGALCAVGAVALIAMTRRLVYARSHAARPPVPGALPGVPAPRGARDLPGMLGGDPAGPAGPGRRD